MARQKKEKVYAVGKGLVDPKELEVVSSSELKEETVDEGSNVSLEEQIKEKKKKESKIATNSASDFKPKESAVANSNSEMKPILTQRTTTDRGRSLLAEVNGLRIYKDTLYVITGKKDESAPTGMVDMGISKMPFPGNRSTCLCRFDRDSNVYDTGFYLNSLCYRGWDQKQKEAECERRIRNIMTPYMEVVNNPLDQSDLSFWDNKTVALYSGRTFNTNDPIQLFELYIAMTSFSLTPKELDGDPRFMSSMYCVEDKSVSVDIKALRAQYKVDSFTKFNTSLSGTQIERDFILDLCLYLDIITRVDLEDDGFYKYQFSDWCDREPSNVELFVEAYNRFMEEDAREIPRFHRMIRHLVSKGIIKTTSDGLNLDGFLLGKDMKGAAMRLAADKEADAARIKLLEEYTRDVDLKEASHLRRLGL